jgi:Dolichyl-phosphate-mannose-protein mannosyltransferase
MQIPDPIVVGRSDGNATYTVNSSAVAISDRWIAVLAVTLMLAAALALQWSSHAYVSELGSYRDESAHYATGLLVRDYIAQHRAISPMDFAKQYYAHYPNVALGHWPPLFYVLQAVWSLLFKSSVASILALVAVISALCGSLVALLVARAQTLTVGVVAGFLFVTNPAVAQNTCQIMADGLLALLMLAATLAFVRFINARQQATKYSLLFGFLTSLAFLTKGSAIALVLVPTVVIVISNRWHLLRKKSFWLAPLLVLLSCGPWYWFARNMTAGTWVYSSPRFVYTGHALWYYAHTLNSVISPLGCVLAIIGIARFLAALRRPAQSHITVETGLFGLLIGVAAVALIVPVGLESRFLIPALPPLIFFAAQGGLWTATRLGNYLPRMQGIQAPLCAVLLCVALFISFKPVDKQYAGPSKVADAILESSSPDFPSVLIVSDAIGEGMFVSDMATRRREFDSIVMRGTKILSDTNWMGTDYRSIHTAPREMVDQLDALPVVYVVLDHSVAPDKMFPHQKTLDLAIAEYPESFERLGSFDAIRDGIRYPGSLQLYRFKHSSPPGHILRLPMSRMLQSDIEVIVPQ